MVSPVACIPRMGLPLVCVAWFMACRGLGLVHRLGGLRTPGIDYKIAIATFCSCLGLFNDERERETVGKGEHGKHKKCVLICLFFAHYKQ